MKRIVLGIEYDGTSWQGWQTQVHKNTVQDRLEAALREFSQSDIAITCAGRTDAGVHALEQVIHFDTAVKREAHSWVRGVNAFLPGSIVVHWACEVDSIPTDYFHARFSAIARTYHYVLYNNPIRSPLLAGKAGWVFRPLDVDKMRVAAQALIGEHDFSAFRDSQCQAKSPLKIMHALSIAQHGALIVFTVHANAFLHHMVRNIVGSLIYVGNGNRSSSWLRQVLDSRDRTQAAPTFMPDGLYLAKIEYAKKWCLPQKRTSPFPDFWV